MSLSGLRTQLTDRSDAQSAVRNAEEAERPRPDESRIGDTGSSDVTDSTQTQTIAPSEARVGADSTTPPRRARGLALAVSGERVLDVCSCKSK
eukprot:6558371-Prymnesium_polylepis.1